MLTEPVSTKEGYTLAGWYADVELEDAWNFVSDTMPNNPMTLYAKWTLNSYDVTFDSKGGNAVASITVDYNELLTKPASDPIKVGYTFGGWYTSEAYSNEWSFTSDRMPAQAMTLYAKWTANSYTVTYESNGGSSVNAASVSYGEMLTEPVTTKEGYTLAGWYTDIALEDEWDFASNTMPDQAITLYAKWTLNSYDVTFDSKGGNSVASITVGYNELLTKPASDPMKEGHTFGGWYTSEAYTNAWSFASNTMPAQAMTLYAKWTANSYTVTFESNGGSSVNAATVSYGEQLTEPVSTKEGYTLAGWYADIALEDEWDFASNTMPAQAITLYAKWTLNSYAVAFDSKGGTAVASITVGYNELLTKPASDPIKVGYTFDGWYTSEAYTNEWGFTSDRMPAQAMTLYAKWTANSYIVTFESNGGSSVNAATVSYGEQLTEPVSTKEGYTLAGWYADIALEDEWDFASNTMPAQAITLYAKWMANSYTVTYESNGGSSINAATVSYGETLTKPVPTKEGYTIEGWYTDIALEDEWNFASNTMPAQAITLYAKWTLNSYAVAFDTKGGTAVASITVGYNELLTKPASDPMKEGYTFGGWYTSEAYTNEWSFTSDAMPAQAMTLYAKWTANSYTVTYESNGGSFVNAASVSYGEMLTEPVTTKEGYTLAGWYTDLALEDEWDFASNTMPAQAMTLYAKWTLNSYAVAFDSKGGNAVASITVGYNELLTKPASDPMKEGHTFGGWYTSEAYTNAWSFASNTMPAQAMTLYAKWTANSYTVTYESNGGSSVNVASVSYGETLTKPVPTKEGYTLEGWYADIALEDEWDFASNTMPAQAITLYAKWTLNSYAVAFDSKGGTAVASITVGYNELLTKPASDPIKVGYTFDGWYTSEAYTNEWGFTSDRMPAQAMTLYAKWTANSYTVTYESNGGSSVNSATVSYGEMLIEPVSTKEGYTLAGWYADVELEEAWSFTSDTMPAGAMTLYAKWTLNSYAVAFDTKGGTAVASITVGYNELLTKPASDPIKVGYTFGGWYTSEGYSNEWSFTSDAMPAQAITLYAKWIVNLDSITATPATVSLAVGKTKELSVKAIYSDESETTVTSSATYSSSNNEVATVDAAGVIKALTAGTAVITVSFEEKTATVQVTVTSSGGSGGNGGNTGGGNGNGSEVGPTPTPTEPTEPAEPTPTPSTQPTVTQPVFNEHINAETVQSIIDREQQAPNISFSDVPVTMWSATVIERAARIGFVSGYTDGTFKPQNNVTRAEFAAMVMKAFGLTSTSAAALNDVEGHWAADAIRTLNALGIVQGYSDGSFRPDQEITRAEIVVILSRLTNFVPSETSFIDVASNSWAADAIGAFAAAGIVTGKGEQTFKPEDAATRAESVAIITRLIDKLLLAK